MTEIGVDSDRRLSFVDAVQRAQLHIAMGALLVMMVTTVCDVILRYVFGRPIHGAYDIVEVLLVVFVFHGMATTFLKRENIVIDLVDQFVSPRFASALVRAADALSIIMLVVVGWAMFYPAVQAYEYGDRKLELGLPVYIVWIAALIGIVGTVICSLKVLLSPRAVREGHR